MTSLCVSRFDKKCGKSGIPDNAKCTKKTAAAGSAKSSGSGSGTPKKGSIVSRIGRKLTGAEGRERKRTKFQKEQSAREKKYGKHSPDANGGESINPQGAVGKYLKSQGIDPNKIGGNSAYAEKIAGLVGDNGRLKSGANDTLTAKLTAQYRLRKDSVWAEGF